VEQSHGYLLDPHTAAAWRVGEGFIGERPQVVVGTAHPAKFSDAVKRAVGRAPEVPPGFEDLHARLERITVIGPDPSELDRILR
jgi:threonine synthase